MTPTQAAEIILGKDKYRAKELLLEICDRRLHANDQEHRVWLIHLWKKINFYPDAPQAIYRSQVDQFFNSMIK